jgi:hypothetical protein
LDDVSGHGSMCLSFVGDIDEKKLGIISKYLFILNTQKKIVISSVQNSMDIYPRHQQSINLLLE